MSEQTSPVTKGAHHIGLTVPDLKKTKAFFVETLGYNQVGEVPDYPAVGGELVLLRPGRSRIR